MSYLTPMEKMEDQGLSLHLDGDMGVTEKIKRAMYDAARQFVYIGFLLWEVEEYNYYSEKGYQNVYEYAETELGFKRSSTKNFIAINGEFGCEDTKKIGGIARERKMSLQPKYEKFNYSQLCEMLSMSTEKRERVQPDMTIKQIREIKKEPEFELEPNVETIPIALPDDKKDIGQTSGQEQKIMLYKNEQEFRDEIYLWAFNELAGGMNITKTKNGLIAKIADGSEFTITIKKTVK